MRGRQGMEGKMISEEAGAEVLVWTMLIHTPVVYSFCMTLLAVVSNYMQRKFEAGIQ